MYKGNKIKEYRGWPLNTALSGMKTLIPGLSGSSGVGFIGGSVKSWTPSEGKEMERTDSPYLQMNKTKQWNTYPLEKFLNFFSTDHHIGFYDVETRKKTWCYGYIRERMLKKPPYGTPGVPSIIKAPNSGLQRNLLTVPTRALTSSSAWSLDNNSSALHETRTLETSIS